MKKSTILGIVALIVVALVAGLSFVAFHPTSDSTPTLGATTNIGPTHNTPENFTQGISIGGPYIEINSGGTIGPGTNYVDWQNKTGRTVYITRADVSTNGYASTTYRIDAYATSTAHTVLYDFTAPALTASTTLLISNFPLATSSAATTTSNFDRRTTTSAGTVAQVASGGHVIIQLSQTYTTPCTGSQCEQATSTNRGFNLPWKLSGYYAP